MHSRNQKNKISLSFYGHNIVRVNVGIEELLKVVTKDFQASSSGCRWFVIKAHLIFADLLHQLRQRFHLFRRKEIKLSYKVIKMFEAGVDMGLGADGYDPFEIKNTIYLSAWIHK